MGHGRKFRRRLGRGRKGTPLEGGRDVLLWAYAADLDDDGVLDAIDVCPRDADPDQLDLDADGVGDVCDLDDDGDGVADDLDVAPQVQSGGDTRAPQTTTKTDAGTTTRTLTTTRMACLTTTMRARRDPSAGSHTEEDQEGDGCSDVDTDEDGWVDQADVCPNVYDPGQADLDGDGVGNLCDDDADNDGVLESDDGCPLDFTTWTSTPSNDATVTVAGTTATTKTTIETACWTPSTAARRAWLASRLKRITTATDAPMTRTRTTTTTAAWTLLTDAHAAWLAA